MGSINKAILCFIIFVGNFVCVAMEVCHLIDNINMGTSLLWPIVGIVFFLAFGIMWFCEGRRELKDWNDPWNERIENDSNE